ncbi:T4 RnlA family RNA ligase [Fibrella forsythiae]|uniref:T4 RnlA family RNA ligase n=1 Tax=Fibrella forsythiae TaxID=2817061 RepID=A0ABS3JNW5_9BACT|nr:T4 RnlA family RNA ligase [Fibrella forsythiae]MBO0951695.1 T4 RnlA family RNA ligase [Fibrella forsythiae]
MNTFIHTLHPALRQHVANGNVIIRQHPDADLFILNYTAQTQFNRVWDEHTLACRGLILNGRGDVIARPFGKFFNLDEVVTTNSRPTLPDEPFVAFEKLDGSLGILYWHKNKACIATRGSFMSEQAQRATYLLQTRYAHVLPHLDRSKTYLFEIIYPENRIVVDYGDRDELVLLAVIDTATGAEETALPDLGFTQVRRFDGYTDMATIRAAQIDNEEGFVLRFASGFRVKVKFTEYVRLHRILTQISSRNIWEYLATNQPFNDVLERVPDEFYDWVKTTVTTFMAQYEAIEAECKAVFQVRSSRKETALYFQMQRYPSVLFLMLDNRDYSATIWKVLRPAYERPFKKAADG